MPIDRNKTYKQANGDEVEIYKVQDGKVAGLAYCSALNTWYPSTWDEETRELIDGGPELPERDFRLIEAPRWLKYKTDDPVYVSSDGVNWYRRHFCQTVGDLASCFDRGKTSFTAKAKSVTPWPYCQKEVPEEGAVW